MPLKDILKKKDHIGNDDGNRPRNNSHGVEDFTFIRTDTNSQEVIEPPTFASEDHDAPKGPTSPLKKILPFRKGSNASTKSNNSAVEDDTPQFSSGSFKGRRQLSQRLHLTSKSRASSYSSLVPTDLPQINVDATTPAEEKEAQWEQRATMLAQGSPLPKPPQQEGPPQLHLTHLERPPVLRQRSASDVKSDETIQEAIRLHEAGDLEQSTKLFGRLAEQGNVLSQVLYGLALRHGWGCVPDAPKAITFLSAAASNSAAIEAGALRAGMKKGGAAKGELVLAMFELANCFRNGWGIQKDPVAARQYYETAANLGDTDAMNEAAWCYLEGFGGKKDKVSQSDLHSSFHAALLLVDTSISISLYPVHTTGI